MALFGKKEKEGSIGLVVKVSNGTAANEGTVYNLGDDVDVEPEEPATSDYSCKGILNAGNSVGDGTYTIDPDGEGTMFPFEVYCDMTTDGGGWTKIEYASDLEHKNRWTTSVEWRWIDNNFATVLTEAQIRAIQEVSTEGKQIYSGSCQYAYHYMATEDNYNFAVGFRFLDSSETEHGIQYPPGLEFEIVEDDCKSYSSILRHTVWEIDDIRVPIINVNYFLVGIIPETKFGSKLTENPAWLR